MSIKSIQTQIKNLFATFIILASILGSLSALTLITSKVGDKVGVSATANCPGGYTWNGSQCEQRVGLNNNTSYNCPSGGNLNGTNCNIDMGGVLSGDNTSGLPSCATFPNNANYQVFTAGISATNTTRPPYTFILCVPNTFPGFYSSTSNNCNAGYNAIKIANYNTSTLTTTYLCVPNLYGGFTSGSGCSANQYASLTQTLEPAIRGGYNNVTIYLCTPNTVTYPATPNTTTSCPAGYQNLGGTPPCVVFIPPLSFTCSPGQYLSNTGTDSCTTCPAGSSCIGGVGAVATPCPIDTYCLAGSSSPTPCPANYSSPAGSTSLAACTPNSVTLNLKALLAGPFDPSTLATTPKMKCSLQNHPSSSSNLLPIYQPYNIAGISYTGNETLPTVSSQDANICDWVLIEVRDGSSANGGLGNLMTAKAGVILIDGNVKESTNATTGNTNNGITLSNLTVDTNYKVILKHRNHIAIATNPTVQFSFTNSNSATLDFTNNVNIKGSNQQNVGTTTVPIYALRPADTDGNGQVDATDRNILITSSEYDGIYDKKDLNLDGAVDAIDRNMSQNTGEATANL